MQYFDDPDGKCELPSSLKAVEWKRPQEFIDGSDKVLIHCLHARVVLSCFD